MENNNPTNRTNFSSLRPTLVEDFSHYRAAFEFIFSDEEILNVGITGAYASGKSSVLKTLEQEENEKKFLHISLATFSTESSLGNEKDESDASLNEIEGKLINQLLHQLKLENIPQSNFKMIPDISENQIRNDTIKTVFGLICAVFSVKFLSFYEFLVKIAQLDQISPYIWTTLFVLSSGVTSFLFYYLIKRLVTFLAYKPSLNSITLFDNTIELCDEGTPSYFNKYLDEILYLFQRSEADVVVFEDIDRYNRNEIFTKLREINFLVNEKVKDNNELISQQETEIQKKLDLFGKWEIFQKVVVPFKSTFIQNSCNKKKKPLRFFYLLRDDVFTSKDRTKFFDFVLPIVPVMDSSNAYDQLKLQLESSEFFKELDQSFLMEISLYIDDLRLLKNICNEFMIYFPMVSKTNQCPNKMLAIIIYKNLFPKDFSQLQMNEGYVHGLFEFKNCLNKNITEKKIDELNQIIERVDREHLQSIDELNCIFNRAYDVPSLKHINGQDRINTKQIRIEAIQNGKVETIAKYREKINKLTETLHKLQEEDLRKIITNDNIHSMFSEPFPLLSEERFNRVEILKSPYFPLIKYLIRNGKIDETYPDYMTYFYGGRISREDALFLRSISDQKELSFSYSVPHPNLVLPRLNMLKLRREECLNFDLMDYLLKKYESSEENMEVCEEIASLFTNLLTPRGEQFVSEYLNRGNHLESFVQSINYHVPEFLARQSYSFIDNYDYIMYTLCFDTQGSIEGYFEQNTKFVEVIQCDMDFLSHHFRYINVAKVKEALAFLGIRCEQVAGYEIHENHNRELVDMIYKNNLYVPNDYWIHTIFPLYYGIKESKDWLNNWATIIFSHKEQPLYSHAKANMNELLTGQLKEVMIGPVDLNDAEWVVLEILNDDSIEETLLKDYIDWLKTQITSLKEVANQNLWDSLFTENLTYSIPNLLTYFDIFGLSENLINFINPHTSQIQIETLQREDYEAFHAAVLCCNSMDNEAYRQMMLTLKIPQDNFQIKGITPEKMNVLIATATLPMTRENLLFMRENYSEDILLQFIESNYEVYASEIIDEQLFDMEETKHFLENVPEDSCKITLLSKTTKQISILPLKISDAVKLYILENNLLPDDLTELWSTYNTNPAEIKSFLLKNAVLYCNQDLITLESFQTSLQEELLSHEEVSAGRKYNLFLHLCPSFTKGKWKKYAKEIELEEIGTVLSGRSTTIVDNPCNWKIIEKLQENNWITVTEPEAGLLLLEPTKTTAGKS